MKFSPFQSILFALIIFQAISSVEPQLLSGVSHVLESITEPRYPSSTKDTNPPPPSQPSSSSHPSQPSPTQQSNPPDNASPSEPSAPPSTQSSSSDKSPSPTNKPPNDSNSSNTSPSTSYKPSSSSNDSNSSTSANPSSSGGSSKSKSPGKTTTTTADGTTNKYDTLLPIATNDSKSVASPNNNDNSTSGSKTGIIVGAVVGSIFGVALVGGALTWINRHGGCARRTKRTTSDFEDYGLADTDFPSNHVSGMQSINGTKSPTIPQLNDQGTFYNGGGAPAVTKEDPYSQYMAGYQQQAMDNSNAGHPAAVVDYNNLAYNASQQQQAYYYQQQTSPQDMAVPHGGVYYDESGGYYYDGSNNGQQQHMYPNQQIAYQTTAADNNHYYKPDQVDHRHT
ncbi:MAG: hypothetical protein EXX96DRAFT_99299 [Benjaminiella poitrasii]|nr:MAG: hypothetical protein EXX96DRAFT_99299 [Benjaminiella poitrasii]